MMNLESTIDQFIRYLSAERNLAERTIDAYQYDLLRFCEYIEAGRDKKPVTIDSIETWDLKEYIAFMKEEHGLKPTTLSRLISALRVFFDYSASSGLIPTNPAAQLHTPKKPKKLPVYLTATEAARAIHHKQDNDPMGERNQVMVLTLVMTGMRVSEMADLSIGDLDFERHTIKVMGKGRKERLIPMNQSVEKALRKWLELRPKGKKDCQSLFLDRIGERITARMIQYAVRKTVKALGLDPRISPHKLRHTFATNLYGQNIDLRDIQELLGHANIVSTSIYTHTNVDKVRAAVNTLHLKKEA